MLKKYRLSKLLSLAGLCARRSSAQYIKEHNITYNNKQIKQFNVFLTIEEAQNNLKVDNRALVFPEINIIYLFHKPTNCVCSHKKYNSCKIIFDYLPSFLKNYYFAGRLDKNSSGLIILSNNGEFIQKITHPKYQIAKEYVVQLSRHLSQKEIEKCKKGILLKNDELQLEKFRFAEISLKNKLKIEYKIILKEGKKREIRRVMEFFGIFVRSLIRIQIGNFSLDGIPEKGYKKLKI